ncbi:MAG: magnesium protoporphyrin IX methyltransferase [Devosia sp.]
MVASVSVDPVPARTYAKRRGELEHYFDRTAADTWAALTSDAPVSKIRATVRAGRDKMRATLLSRLGEDLTGRTLLDAGCGTGALSGEAATRGATVTAVDLSPTLVEIARERVTDLENGAIDRVTFASGDMLDPAHGTFDHAVAMDSLIHYQPEDIVAALAALAPRVTRSILFTVAPRTPALAVMHTVGKAFPRSDRAPAIVPIAPRKLAAAIARAPELGGFAIVFRERIVSGFYTSEAVELARQ